MPRQPNKPLSKGSQKQKLSWEPKATETVETEGMIQQERDSAVLIFILNDEC